MRSMLRLIVAAVSCATVLSAAPRPFFDDPLTREPETQDASRAQPNDIGLFYDIAWNLFVTPRRAPANVRAKNVNTVDEVPDSSWFTNRILPRKASLDDLIRGPHLGAPPNADRWVITREKSAGYAPGFTARDANGETWFVSFDSPGSAEGATSAIVVASNIFFDLGYNQVESYITHVDPRKIDIDAKATMKRPNGKRTPLTRRDLSAILERAQRSADGTYRAAAGRLLPGKVLGPFRYEGTRPDDPNDVIDHQHRRELRALRVFGAWTNLTDLKAGNTLDTVVTVGGRGVVRHYLQDVGSTFGIGANGPHDWDEGFEYFYDSGPSRKRLYSLGFALSPWQTADYTIYPSIGRFEADAFDPRTWKPHAATSAYMEMLADDAFWAARRVAAFDDALIRALVHTGQFSDPSAEEHLAQILIKRRDKIAKAYLTAINPVASPRLAATGELTFENAAVAAGVADVAVEYLARWSAVDAGTGAARTLGESRSRHTSLHAPVPLPAGSIVQVAIAAETVAYPEWRQPVTLSFRQAAAGWTLVGLDRGIGTR